MSGTMDNSFRSWMALLCGRLVAKAVLTFQVMANNAKLRHRLFVATILMALAFGSLAIGQTQLDQAQLDNLVNSPNVNPVTGLAPQTTVPTKAIDTTALIGIITTAVNNAVNSVYQNPQLQSMGKTIEYFLVFAMMVWGGIKTLAAGKGISELFGEWVPVFVAFVIVESLLTQDAQNQLVGMMNMIASAVSSTSMDNVSGVFSTALAKTFSSINMIIDMPSATMAQQQDASTLDMLQYALFKVADVVVIYGMKIVTAFIMVVASCVFLAIAIMSFVSVKLVMGFAPILVPFLLFPKLSFLFDGWLKFFLGASMTKIVAAFMLNFTNGIYAAMTTVASTIASDTAGASAKDALVADVVLYSMVLLLAVLAALLMAQVPGIATGLLSGHANAASFQGLGGVTQTMGSKMGTYAGRSAGAGVANVAGGTAQGLYNFAGGRSRAAGLGADDARNGVPANARKFSNAARGRAYLAGHSQAKTGMAQEREAAKKPSWADS